MCFEDGPLLPTVSSSRKPSELDPAACAPLTSAPSSAAGATNHCVLLGREEAERDDSQTCLPSNPVRGDKEGQELTICGSTDGGVMETTGRSSPFWSSAEPNMNVYSHSGKICCHTLHDIHCQTNTVKALTLASPLF